MVYYLLCSPFDDIDLIDESGWVWFIPLHDGTTSVGVVMDKDIASRKKKLYDIENHDEKLHAFYLDELKHAPGAIKLIGNGVLRTRPGESAIKTTSDFSYCASQHAGDHFRIAGDAGGKYVHINDVGSITLQSIQHL